MIFHKYNIEIYKRFNRSETLKNIIVNINMRFQKCIILIILIFAISGRNFNIQISCYYFSLFKTNIHLQSFEPSPEIMRKSSRPREAQQ